MSYDDFQGPPPPPPFPPNPPGSLGDNFWSLPPRPPAWEPPPAPRPKSKMALWILLSCAGVAVAGLSWYAFGPPPHRAEESADEKFRKAAEAFNGPPVAQNSEQITQILATLNDFQKALHAQDAALLSQQFDFERMLDEVSSAGVNRRFRGDERAGVLKGMSESMPKTLLGQAGLLKWDSVEIRRCVLNDDADEALVYYRAAENNELSLKNRWWFKRTGNKWRIYDMEELATGMRTTTAMALAFNELLGGKDQGILLEMPKMRPVMQALSQRDFAELDRLLPTIRCESLPQAMQAMFRFIEACNHMAHNRIQETLTACDQAEKLHPDMPMLHLIRARMYNALARFDEARTSAERYLQLLGADSEGFRILAAAQIGLKNSPAAVEAYRKALDDQPGSTETLLELAAVLPADGKAEIGERFAKLTKPADQFNTLIGKFRESGDEGARSAVIAAMKKIDPNRPEVLMADGWAAYGKKQYAEGAALAKKGWLQANDPQQKLSFQELFLDCHLAANTVLTGYGEAFDVLGAFEYLASSLIEEERPAELAELIAAHAVKHPGDSMLLYFRGELAAAKNDWSAAVGFYREGWTKAKATLTKTQQENREAFRGQLVYAMYKSGKAAEALKTIRPRDKTFQQLAQSAVNDRDAVLLETLLLDQRTALKSLTALPRWEAELLWLKGNYAGLERLLLGSRAAFDKNEEYRYHTLLIRGLLHAQKYAEAEAAVKANPSKYDQRYYPVLIAAGQGQVAETIAAMQAAQDENMELRWRCYSDEMLEPILKRDAFAPFREKFPDPRKQAEPKADQAQEPKPTE